jgi:K(+)-stimulated pyrophosphate-energized sodium pump
VRTTEAARYSINSALQIAFRSGSILGLSVVALGFTTLLTFYLVYRDIDILFGLSLGASLIALFARVGGGIYTKAADVAADIVGKIEAQIPEDDPRNPAVIADNVGDNVGDVAGMGADLFESYIGTIVSAIALGAIAFELKGVFFALLVSSIGIIASVICIAIVKTKDDKNISKAFHKGNLVSSIIVIIGTFLSSMLIFKSPNPFIAILCGLIAGILIGITTQYYTSDNYNPVKELSKSATTSTATNIIEGLSLGMSSTIIPIVIVTTTIFLGYLFVDLYGIALAALGMLSTLGITLAVDAYGPVADNAGGIAEMAKLPKEVRDNTDRLDSFGNTTAAMGKGFAIGSAALTSLALFTTYTAKANITSINLSNPLVMIGLLLGGMLPFAICSMTMRSVGRSAFEMITEVRRQFKSDKNILLGKSLPDYTRCIDISTKSALKETLLPSITAVISPILVGILLGLQSLGGFLAGSLTTGVLLAIFMANAGGAFDNAKKYIEAGNFGGKGSEAHMAAIIGDTVGDPMKDTSGPSLNILIKLISIVSLIFATALLAN